MGVTFVGMKLAGSLLNGTSILPIISMGWGGSEIPFHDSQIGLGSELFPATNGTQRNLFYETRQTEFPFTNIYSELLETTQLNGGSLYEEGLFDTRSGAAMYTRQTRALLVKSSGLRILADNYLEMTRG